ncbi:hypothetical protein [Roseovarius atlanticus]|uniref:hypothetical protein n=1 Tax=Roseovarius atlanticus TaxID=1641875 RepID=UPI001C958AB1|nr:hypothetical protein [Roseovarius atlanticus]MBY5988202.1 hypothetical protein [Roseovarius atlanticus]MBY6123593.1 hypothetical protein [Roseovarius atlanticus]MBY6148088.1 hypothetical protein [Roseovarius atlanticus]
MSDRSAPTTAELAAELDNAPAAPSVKPSAGNGGGKKKGRAKGEIFDDCPIVPLGVRGKNAYYLDGLGQLRAIDNHNAQNIMSLFGHHIPKLFTKFPQFDKDGNRKNNRFDQTSASLVMHQAAAECGVFNPDNAVRGVGAWTDDNGELILHLGDKVLYRGDKRSPGRIDGRIYPAASPIPHPTDQPVTADPVEPLLEVLGSWNWTQPDLHPFVALGMIATQMLCGALDWRPVFWLLAPAGAGKSEFQRLLKMLHGDDGLIQSTDATKSGITSQLGQSSLPVAVDELEPGDERSTKEKQIIELARVAASGGQWFRGSADQTGVGGKVYSAFLFSSILIPGVMKSQDVQRLIVMEMKPLDKSAAKLSLDPRTWRARGARLKALLVERWPEWPERLAAWRQSLELAQVVGRDADNWATVMAMADLAQNDELAAEDVRENWARKVAFQVATSRSDTTNDAEAMLLHLMSQVIDPFRRGQQFNVAQWVMAAGGLPGAPPALTNELGSGATVDAQEKRDRMKKANEVLAGHGLRVYSGTDAQTLFIMNKPIERLCRLFQGSDWANGVWQQSAKRVPGAVSPSNALTLAGITSRGVSMPLSAIPGLMSLPMDNAQSTTARAGDDLEDFK